LISNIISTYYISRCPKCGEKSMDLLSVSPTGQSIEYKCLNCSKKIIAKLIPEKDGSIIANQFSRIRSQIASMEGPFDDEFKRQDVHCTFQVNDKTENQIESYTREMIPQNVRNEVWRRDEANCVECGSNYRLEYDHIIPVSKGGSNTARNIQLLCETCNRKKSAKI
jgi:hypothetical protein